MRYGLWWVAVLAVLLALPGCASRQVASGTVLSESEGPIRAQADSSLMTPRSMAPDQARQQKRPREPSASQAAPRIEHEYLKWPAQTLDMALADLQSDGAEELFVLTPDSVVVFASATKIEGFALSAQRGDWVSRDRIGSLVVDTQTKTVFVNTSDLAKGETHQWSGHGFVNLEQPLPAFPLGLRPSEAGPEVVLKKWAAGTNYFVERIAVYDDPRGMQTEALCFYAAAVADIDSAWQGPENILLGLDGRITVYDEFFTPVGRDEQTFGSFARLFGKRLVVTSARPRGQGDSYLVLEWNGQGWSQVHHSREYLGALVCADLGDLDGDGQEELVVAEQRGTPRSPTTVFRVEVWPPQAEASSTPQSGTLQGVME